MTKNPTIYRNLPVIDIIYILSCI